MPTLNAVADAPELSEHAQYLSDTHLLALLEMGLEATLYDQRAHDGRVGGPIDYLATWLMRNNPRHSKEGKALIERLEGLHGSERGLHRQISGVRRLLAGESGLRSLDGEFTAAVEKEGDGGISYPTSDEGRSE